MTRFDIRRLGPADAADGFEVYGTEPRVLKSEDGCADEIMMVRFLLNAKRSAAE